MGILDGNPEDEVARREKFQEFLGKSGVEAELTRVLLRMYSEPEWPDYAIQYIITALRAPPGINVESLAEENNELRIRNEELEATVDALMDQIEAFKRGNDDDN